METFPISKISRFKEKTRQITEVGTVLLYFTQKLTTVVEIIVTVNLKASSKNIRNQMNEF